MSDREKDGFFPDGDIGKRSGTTLPQTDAFPSDQGETGQGSDSSESSNGGSDNQTGSGDQEGD